MAKKDEHKKGFAVTGLFAGCGWPSEGFIRAGYAPVAHVESAK